MSQGFTSPVHGREAEFRRLFADETVTLDTIATRFGYANANGVSHVARRLHLPQRARGQKPGKRLTEAEQAQLATARLASNHAWARRASDRQLARCEQWLAEERLNAPQPTCYRCAGCGGRATEAEGHPQCRAVA